MAGAVLTADTGAALRDYETEGAISDYDFANKTIWTGDNLDILRSMNSECVDLIYLDPPFNSSQDYSA